MKNLKIFLFLLAFATNPVAFATCDNTTDSGVVINGVRWATRNVDAPGTFAANPQDAGMLYQWNRNIGWSSTDPMINSDGGTTWDSSLPSITWEAANCPCPPGWRIPTREELISLNNSGSTWVTDWNGTGINGRVFGTYPNQIFLPAAGRRGSSHGVRYLVGTHGSYWSSTLHHRPGNVRTLWTLWFAGTGSNPRSDGFLAGTRSLRCVAE